VKAALAGRVFAPVKPRGAWLLGRCADRFRVKDESSGRLRLFAPAGSFRFFSKKHHHAQRAPFVVFLRDNSFKSFYAPGNPRGAWVFGPIKGGIPGNVRRDSG
jgi:hypothetical protein